MLIRRKINRVLVLNQTLFHEVLTAELKFNSTLNELGQEVENSGQSHLIDLEKYSDAEYEAGWGTQPVENKRNKCILLHALFFSP
jgi:hypothetical protein